MKQTIKEGIFQFSSFLFLYCFFFSLLLNLGILSFPTLSFSKTIGEIFKDISKREDKNLKLKKTRQNFQGIKVQKRKKKVNKRFKEIVPPKKMDLYYKKGDKGRLEQLTNQSIKQLYKLSLRLKNNKKRGEIWLRLAKAYIEKANLVEFRLQEKYNKKLDAYHLGKRKRKPRLNLKVAQNYNKKAINLYNWFVKYFPKDRRIDQVLFFLGYNNFKLKRFQEGERYYKQLIRNHRKSSYYIEANFALAEYYFDSQIWSSSLRHYQSIIRKKGRNRFYFFSLYKAAWCQYKLENFKMALKKIDQIIRISSAISRLKRKTLYTNSVLYLKDQSQKDIVLFFVKGGEYQKARRYFEDIMNSSSAEKNLQKLAEHYKDANEFKKAKHILLEMIRKNPLSKEAFDYYRQVVYMDTSAGLDYEKMSRMTRYWIQKFGPKSRWHSIHHKKDPDFTKKSLETMEIDYRSFILNQHKKAYAVRKIENYKKIEKDYQIYFKVFENTPHLDNMHFFFAELLFELKKYEKAASHYEWIVQNKKDSDHYKNASLNLVLSLEKTLPSFVEIEKRRKKSKEPLKFNRKIQNFYDKSTKYLAVFPEEKQSIQITYSLALLDYHHGKTKKAFDRFSFILKKYPKTKFALYSSQLMLEVFAEKEDYKTLDQLIDKIFAASQHFSPAFVEKMKEIKKRNKFKLLEVLEKEEKDDLKVAKKYEEFFSNNREDELGLFASYNAAIRYEKGGNYERALYFYDNFLKSKKSKNSNTKKKKATNEKPSLYKNLEKNALKARALIYKKIGQYKKAADELSNYAKKYPRDPKSLAFLFDSAFIYDGLRRYRNALVNYDLYSRNNKNKKKSIEALYLIAKVWEERKNYWKALVFYDRYIKSGSVRGAHEVEVTALIARANLKVEREKRVNAWYKRVLSLFPSLSESEKPLVANYAAEAQLYFAQKTYQNFINIKMPKSQVAQQKALQKKIEFLEILRKELEKVISYGEGDTLVAASALLAKAFQSMFKILSLSPIPQGLTEEEKAVYEKEIKKASEPFLKQSEESFTLAFQKATELGVYGKWREEALSYLRKKDPFFSYKDKKEKFFQSPIEQLKYMKNYRTHRLIGEEDKLQLIESVRNEYSDKRTLNEISKLLQKDTKNPFILNLLGVLHLLRDEPGMAEIVFKRILESNKDSSVVYNNLAILFIKEKDFYKARDLLFHQRGLSSIHRH